MDLYFEEIYNKVRGIVLKCRKDYYLHSWEREDWEQEGMLVLYNLLMKHENLIQSDMDLYRYFKTKFRNHILDYVRKQESEKRKFNKPNYEEISEVGHRLSEKKLKLDDEVLFKEDLKAYKEKLSAEGLYQFSLIVQGKSFRGKKAMIRKMACELSEHNPFIY